MTFTIEIPLIGAMFLEVSGEWTPATPLENNEPCDAAEITIITEIIPVVRHVGKLKTVYKQNELNASSNIIMEQSPEFVERLIDALEDRGGY